MSRKREPSPSGASSKKIKEIKTLQTLAIDETVGLIESTRGDHYYLDGCPVNKVKLVGYASEFELDAYAKIVRFCLKDTRSLKVVKHLDSSSKQKKKDKKKAKDEEEEENSSDDSSDDSGSESDSDSDSSSSKKKEKEKSKTDDGADQVSIQDIIGFDPSDRTLISVFGSIGHDGIFNACYVRKEIKELEKQVLECFQKEVEACKAQRTKGFSFPSSSFSSSSSSPPKNKAQQPQINDLFSSTTVASTTLKNKAKKESEDAPKENARWNNFIHHTLQNDRVKNENGMLVSRLYSAVAKQFDSTSEQVKLYMEMLLEKGDVYNGADEVHILSAIQAD